MAPLHRRSGGPGCEGRGWLRGGAAAYPGGSAPAPRTGGRMPSRPSTPRSRLPARGPALPARTVLALVLSLAAVTAPAQAAPESREGADTGRAQAALTRVVSEDRDQPPQARAAVQGYPRRTALTEPPADPADASRRLGLTPYHALAPSLNRLQQSSDRVSVEVAGRTVTGR